MSDISKWSNTAGGNSSPAPDGAPEGMSPASVNDTMREMMAATRRQWEGKEFFNFGDTPTYSNAASFTVPGNLAARYHANRRIVATGTGAMGTIYGTLSAPTYNSGPNNTTVNVAWDSGSLDSTLASVGLGAAATNDAEPRLFAQQSLQVFASDTGTANAYAVTLNPPPTAYITGQKVSVKIANANTGSSTLNVNGIGAKNIVRRDGAALFPGDLPAGSICDFEYDGTNFQVTSGGIVNRVLQSVTASVASNALTLGLNPTVLDFRSATLSNGIPNTRTIGAAISITIPTGATIGTVNGQTARLAILAIDNGGTVELAVTNLSGGVNLDETTLINTTAMSTSSTSANVVYSTSARTGVPFRVVGFVDINEATAGTWATAPTTVQGQGGQALTALQAIGYGQTWQVVTASRALGTTYYNTTGRPIMVAVTLSNSNGNAGVGAVINGVTVQFAFNSGAGTYMGGTIIVPAGASYQIASTGGTLNTWSELR